MGKPAGRTGLFRMSVGFQADMSAQAHAHKGYAGLRAEYLDGTGKLHRDDV
jgi:hypothetical protein